MPEIRERALELRRSGASVTAICLSLDVNYATLRSWLWDAKICEVCGGPVEKGEWHRCRWCREHYGIAQHV